MFCLLHNFEHKEQYLKYACNQSADSDPKRQAHTVLKFTSSFCFIFHAVASVYINHVILN